MLPCAPTVASNIITGKKTNLQKAVMRMKYKKFWKEENCWFGIRRLRRSPMEMARSGLLLLLLFLLVLPPDPYQSLLVSGIQLFHSFFTFDFSVSVKTFVDSCFIQLRTVTHMVLCFRKYAIVAREIEVVNLVSFSKKKRKLSHFILYWRCNLLNVWTIYTIAYICGTNFSILYLE